VAITAAKLILAFHVRHSRRQRRAQARLDQQQSFVGAAKVVEPQLLKAERSYQT
jgi:hypothetical protein